MKYKLKYFLSGDWIMKESLGKNKIITFFGLISKILLILNLVDWKIGYIII